MSACNLQPTEKQEYLSDFNVESVTLLIAWRDAGPCMYNIHFTLFAVFFKIFTAIESLFQARFKYLCVMFAILTMSRYNARGPARNPGDIKKSR